MTRAAQALIAAAILPLDMGARVWRWLTTEPACRWAQITHEEWRPASCARCPHPAHPGAVCQDASVLDACGCITFGGER